MTLRGVGIDIVKVARIGGLVEEWGNAFLGRVFTPEELDYCLSRRRKYEHLAGRFAVKESLIKAAGERLPWKSMEVLSSLKGGPEIRFTPPARDIISAGTEVYVSITHQKEYALAIAVLEAPNEESSN